MSTSTKKALAVGMGSALLIASGSAVAANAEPAHQDTLPPSTVSDQQTNWMADFSVQLDEVQGSFSYAQAQVTSNEEIARVFAGASHVLCGSTIFAEYGAEEAAAWPLAVVGDVSNPLETTVGELAATSEIQSILMGCTCAANPADGLASIEAMVEGIPVTVLLQMAGITEQANTIVFVSDDGYEIALPLSYVTSRYCPLVFKINGSPLADSIGGVNQLWLGSTAASYFARNVIEIRVETRSVLPVAPDSEEARESFQNLPNIGVKFGGEVA